MRPLPIHHPTPGWQRSTHAACGLLACLLSACALPMGLQPGPHPAPPARVIIVGEQHDQPAHQAHAAALVRTLAQQGRLAAVVIEMAEAGRSTAAQPKGSTDETAARAALAWNDAGWPWSTYRAVVMNAVQAGVPVLGGNLPRAEQARAMQDTTLDQSVPPAVAQTLTLAVREGHCNLLPREMEPAMLRIQLARDQRMARTVMAALAQAGAGQSVLLLTGEQHASRDRGVPLHLQGLPARDLRVIGWDSSAGLVVDEQRFAERVPSVDHCAALAASRAVSSP